MRLLIYGAGVIESFYATLFSQAGFDTTIYARGRRLSELSTNGLLYKEKKKTKKADVKVLDTLRPNDIFDFSF